MKLSTLLVSVFTLATGVASAASTFDVRFYSPVVIAGQELKPGDYKLDLDGNKATIRSGKTSVSTTVKPEQASEAFKGTAVRYHTEGGKNKVEEIRIGGTSQKLRFTDSADVSSAN